MKIKISWAKTQPDVTYLVWLHIYSNMTGCVIHTSGNSGPVLFCSDAFWCAWCSLEDKRLLKRMADYH